MHGTWPGSPRASKYNIPPPLTCKPIQATQSVCSSVTVMSHVTSIVNYDDDMMVVVRFCVDVDGANVLKINTMMVMMMMVTM